MSFKLDLGFASVAERIKNEHQDRLEKAKRVFKFGVPFLDEAVGGIFPNDLILIGAKTGTGKTELASQIAFSAAEQGKRAHYFALEAEPSELERRMKYRLVCKLAQERLLAPARRRLNFTDWNLGRLDDLTRTVDAEAERIMQGAAYRGLFLYYKQSDFTVDDLQQKFLAIQDQTDLIVLDHLHYVDTDDQNENRGVKQIVKRIRDLSISMGKPVIVVAHIRKSDRRFSSKVPELEDFHGTSDISKIATKAIMVAPAYDLPKPMGEHKWPTYMQIAKCRMDGSRTRYVAVLNYDPARNSYDDEYLLGRFPHGSEDWEQLAAADLPHWYQR